MDIKDLGRKPAPLEPAAPVAPVRKDHVRSEPQPSGAKPRPREDSVEISDQARSRAAEGESGTEVPQGTLPAERLLEMRRLIQAKAHDSPQVIRSIARAIAASGDV